MFDVQGDLYTGTCPDYYTEIAAMESEGMDSLCDTGQCHCPDHVAARAVPPPAPRAEDWLPF